MQNVKYKIHEKRVKQNEKAKIFQLFFILFWNLSQFWF